MTLNLRHSLLFWNALTLTLRSLNFWEVQLQENQSLSLSLPSLLKDKLYIISARFVQTKKFYWKYFVLDKSNRDLLYNVFLHFFLFIISLRVVTHWTNRRSAYFLCLCDSVQREKRADIFSNWLQHDITVMAFGFYLFIDEVCGIRKSMDYMRPVH